MLLVATPQVDALLRQRSGFDVLEASRVLGGLSKLVLELPNLEMPDLIAQQVMRGVRDMTEHLHIGMSMSLHPRQTHDLRQTHVLDLMEAVTKIMFWHLQVLGSMDWSCSVTLSWDYTGGCGQGCGCKHLTSTCRHRWCHGSVPSTHS